MGVEEAIAKRRKVQARESARRARANKGDVETEGAPKKKEVSWRKIGGIAAAAIVVLGGLTYVAMAPKKGGPMLGVCKVFVERSVFYPTTIKYQYIEQFRTAVRLGYMHIDEFGQVRLDETECGFRPDVQRGMVLNSVLLNRTDVSQDTVDRFNVGLPTIFANMPDLVLVPPLPEDLMDLWQEN